MGNDRDVLKFIDNFMTSLCVFNNEDAFLLGKQSELIEALLDL